LISVKISVCNLEIHLTLETPVRLSASLQVNRDPLDFQGDVTHFFVLPTSHSLPSALATVILRTDEFGERKSDLALWDIVKSTSALHATFSQLSSVSNIPAPKEEAVRVLNLSLTIAFYLFETTMRVAWRCGICGYTHLCQLDHIGLP
jgi:hypothetical protein